jgi:hypothetical protein
LATLTKTTKGKNDAREVVRLRGSRPSFKGRVITVTAFDTRRGKTLVIGGSDDPADHERFNREDLPTMHGRFHNFASWRCFDSFSHAIHCIEGGMTPEAARAFLAARGY